MGNCAFTADDSLAEPYSQSVQNNPQQVLKDNEYLECVYGDYGVNQEEVYNNILYHGEPHNGEMNYSFSSSIVPVYEINEAAYTHNKVEQEPNNNFQKCNKKAEKNDEYYIPNPTIEHNNAGVKIGTGF